MSLVLAADYRVPDFDHWWATLAGDLPRLPGLGPHHVVVYRSLHDASRVFVTIGVTERGPVDILLRSPVMLSWFDSAGVEEIPPMFAGEVVEKLDLGSPSGPAGPAATAETVIVAAIAPVGQLDRLRDRVHTAADRFAASGVRRFWIYRALDDQGEVMVLQEVATEQQAERWIHHPDDAAAFMSEAGEGPYPPLFVGRLVQAIEVPPSAPPDRRHWLPADPALLPAGTPAVPALFVDLNAPGTPAEAAALLQTITPPPAATPAAAYLGSTIVDHLVLIGLAEHHVRAELA